MPLSGATTYERPTIPLSGGARAVRPWVGGGFETATHPVWRSDRRRCTTAVVAPATPPERGFFLGVPHAAERRHDL